MISSNDFLAIKERLLVAASAARRMVEINEPTLLYDEQEYWRVHVAFSELRSDVTAILTELDTLRAMFSDRVNEFLMGGGLNDAVDVSGGNRQDIGEAVAGVPVGASVGSGESQQPDAAAVGGDVPARRTRRRRKQMPQPERDQSGLQDAPSAVDGGAG